MANIIIGITILVLFILAIRRIIKHRGCDCGDGKCGACEGECHCKEHQEK